MGVLNEPTARMVQALAGATAVPLSRRRGQPSTSPAAAANAPLPEPLPGSRELVRRLERGGLATREAGNVVAYLLGLKPVASGWRVTEIEHLRFLRALAADGRLES